MEYGFHSGARGTQGTATQRMFSFKDLKPSTCLELRSYDIDHFGETEKYAGACSVPLSVGQTPIMRARLSLPASTLSLLKTFPRIVRGFDLPEAVAVVVPMGQANATRINGQPIGNGVFVLKGRSDCVVYEPADSLWGIVYLARPRGDLWSSLDDGYHLLAPAPDVLAALRHSIVSALGTAANHPEFLDETPSGAEIEQSLVLAVEAAIRTSTTGTPVHATTEGYRRIVAEMEKLIRQDFSVWNKTTELAERVGVSVRTLQSATQAICGMSPHRYSRVLRLWSVRKQLRHGSPGRSVKACAIGHGFWHLSEFAANYKAAFGELPSDTLYRARRT